jgi:uncharacterized membrane protein YdcZ (DUF606 family)
VATWPYYLFAVAAGAMLPIQFGINAQLASWVDENPLTPGRLLGLVLVAAGVAAVRFL